MNRMCFSTEQNEIRLWSITKLFLRDVKEQLERPEMPKLRLLRNKTNFRALSRHLSRTALS